MLGMSRDWFLFLLLSIFAVSTEANDKQNNIRENPQLDLNGLIDEVHKLENLLKRQEHTIAQQGKRIALQEKRVNSQEKHILEQVQQIEHQSNIIDALKQGLSKEDEYNTDQNKKIEQCLSKTSRRYQYSDRRYHAKGVRENNITIYDTTVYGCLYDVMTMSCEGQGMVFVTNAEYGQYAQECSDECCPPDTANDCTERLQTEDSEGWANLVFACNYEASCSFQHQAFGMTTCPVEKLADYMTVSYVCSEGGQTWDPVAFTAYATLTRSYSAGDTLIFDYVLTNKGGHYHATNYTFVCPVDGLYMFYVNVLSDDVDYMIARIMLDDTLLVSAFADELTTTVDDMNNHASNLVFTDCLAYQQVWVESYDSGAYMSSTSNRLSTFSGYLVTPY